MKHFINEKDDLVREALTGLLLLSPALARLDGFPATKVVLRTDWDRSKVALVSGGGAGHEPAHAGFVGLGMLTAAVSGEVFASPSVDAVLAAILAVTGEPGCLVIVKSYTGDRLNFGLACESARALGKKVEMVIVSDDVALPDAVHPRGVAGTLFVHKVAGHLAERGADLATVTAAASRVAGSVASIGIALSSCTIPGRPAEERMTPHEAELGLGIHGEPGVSKIPLAPARELVDAMLARLAPSFADHADRFAMLVNGLGGVPNIEMSVVVKCALESELGARTDVVVGPASLMTSLDMKGFSLSLLPLDPDTREALLSEVGPVAWPRASLVNRTSVLLPLPQALARLTFPASAHPRTQKALETICRTLVDAAPTLDALDARIGDGDTGTTLATAARTLLAQLPSLPLAEPASLLHAISSQLSLVMGGSSGVLLSIFTGAAGSASSAGATLPRALLAGAARVQEVGGASLGDRTMLDALLPALSALDLGKDLSEVAQCARRGAADTGAMTTAKAGRASYLGADSLRDVMDPGAAAVALVFEALARLG